MDVAIIGAAGACGRALAVQLLERRIIPPYARLQLIGHRGGSSETELWGLRCDLQDAYVEQAPRIDIETDASAISANLVVMLAGQTIPHDPEESVDRSALATSNAQMFTSYADVLAGLPSPPVVIVQSNPVELGVQIFASRLGRHRVLGAGSWSDTQRFRREIALEFGVRRTHVQAFTVGQHGDHLVPVWSKIRVRGVEHERVDAMIAAARGTRSLADMPQEIRDSKAQMIALIQAGEVAAAWDYVKALTPGLRTAVKPFFTHFTSGRTTEVMTAHAAADLVNSISLGRREVITAQVALEGEWLGLTGTTGAPVTLSPQGWSHVAPVDLPDDEADALRAAVQAALSGRLSGLGLFEEHL